MVGSVASVKQVPGRMLAQQAAQRAAERPNIQSAFSGKNPIDLKLCLKKRSMWGN